LVDKEYHEKVAESWEKVLKEGSVYDVELVQLKKDGSKINTLVSVTRLDDESGKPSALLAMVLDITERKQAEADLKASEEHFRVALENSPMLVYTTDRNLRYTWIYNPAFDFNTANVIGKTDEELNDPKNILELVALKRSVLETGIGTRQEIQLRYQGGTHFYDVTVEPLRNEKGEISGLTVAAIDITERKRLEQAMLDNQIKLEIQRRLMEQREQERLTVAQEIHDGPIQSLAATIIGLQLTKDTLSNPILQTELENIGSNIRSAVQELRDILAELRPPLLERFGLSEAMRMHAEEFSEKYLDLDLTHDIAEDQGQLSNDACLSLFRVYQEALSNIVRHAGATKAKVRFSFVDQMAILEIQDNGKGMDVVPNWITLTEQGHYGLAGMKERAEVVNGQFELQSGSGAGTIITVKIPINKKME
jgi:PAS domain S-box-containing protein